MKYLSYISLVVLLWSCEQTVYENPDYTLVFEDHFRTETIDESKWNFEISVKRTIEWYKDFLKNNDSAYLLCEKDILDDMKID